MLKKQKRHYIFSASLACRTLKRTLSHQFFDKLLKNVRVMIDIILSMLNRNRPLVVEARREKDAAVSQEQPVGIREAHIDIPPGAGIRGALVSEHGATLFTEVCHVHWPM